MEDRRTPSALAGAGRLIVVPGYSAVVVARRAPGWIWNTTRFQDQSCCWYMQTMQVTTPILKSHRCPGTDAHPLSDSLIQDPAIAVRCSDTVHSTLGGDS